MSHTSNSFSGHPQRWSEWATKPNLSVADPLKTSQPQGRKMYKGKGRETRDLHGKVRTIQSLWTACGVKQLLMRVFRAPTHPFQAHHCRQRQLLPPCLVPHSSPGWLLLAVRPGWAFCPLLFHAMNTLKLYTGHFLFQIGNRIAGYVSRYHCSLILSPGV